MTSLVTLKTGSGRPATEAARGGSVRPVGKRVYIETYGCQMNINDTELMAGVLADRGYVQVPLPAEADVILINTCAIRDHAEQRVLGRIGQLQQYRRDRPELVLGVTGCMAQRLGSLLLEDMAGVDLVAGPDAYRKLGGLVEEIQVGAMARGQALLELDSEENYEGVDSIRGDGVSAWITVQRGCDHRCTFCIVPYVRGGEKNRRPERILSEVEGVAQSGYSEVTLLGQTVNSYRHGDWDFARLLRAVARTPGIRRVRFTSPHPNDVTEDMLVAMREEPAVCRQLHLPVQSGSNRILKRMVRRYTVEEFEQQVDRVRERVPDIALSTDVIVGFPGETEEEYRATLDLMRRVRFDDAFLYRYSLRDGTPATRFPDADFVSDETAQSRLAELIETQRSIQRELSEREVGEVREVLVERPARSAGDMLGRTETNKVVAFPGEPALVGTYVQVRLLHTSGATFTGERAT
jgi:tRNA-2-methylthio-N6-dimethylallyladenosine synthase